MADILDPIALNVQGVRDLVTNKINKVNGGVNSSDEGVTGDLEDALTLKMDDEELLRLANEWTIKYAGYEAKIKPIQEKNKSYYLGKQREGSNVATDGPIATNLLFEAEETFLPAALSKNPEPVVYADNSPEGNKIAGDVKTMLQYHADVLVLRRKLAMMVRQWSIYHLGVLKYGWNDKVDDISVEVRKIQDFIFDPNGYVDAWGDFTSYLGERITVSANKLTELFPEHKAYITVLVDGNMGTDVTYTEWWTDEMCFVTFKDKILDKHKNEFYNHDKDITDEFGLPTQEKGKNHFGQPKKPYTFLSVFSLQEQPHDITGLIEQNIPQQNFIARRTYQIDMNLTRNNNSTAFSENNFTQETAKQAASAFTKGNPVLVPSGGPIAEAIVRFPAEGFPDAAFKELEMNKETLRSSFGVQGISSQPANEDTTARGMILNQQYDNTRIGGGIGDAIEQVADNAFNWFVQLYFVYYDEPHFAAVMGQMKATEYVVLSQQDFGKSLVVSVAPDSMKPKDEVTQMNQALTLWQEGALDPQSLLTMLDFPDPKETAGQMWLYHTNPQAYGQLNFPDLVAQLQQVAPQQPQAPQGGGAPAPQVPQSQPPTTGGVEANPSLSSVPLPQ